MGSTQFFRCSHRWLAIFTLALAFGVNVPIKAHGDQATDDALAQQVASDVSANQSDPSQSDPSNESPVNPPGPQLTKAPTILTPVEAVYPEAAAQERLSGTVLLSVVIGPEGEVQDVQVIQGAGHGFDESAVTALRQFRFTPAEIDHVPAAVAIDYAYEFVPPPEAQVPTVPEEPAPLPVSIRGKLLERGSRSAVGHALIQCETAQGEDCPLDVMTQTDELGQFELRLPPGTYVLGFLSTNHDPFRTTEEAISDNVLEVTYHLMPNGSGGFLSVVKGEREKREATRRTVSREEVQTVPGAMGDAIRAVHNLPGVARSAYLGGQMSVRGTAPSETLSYMDGVQIPLLFHFLGGPSVINPEFVDQIDFLPGGFGPEYGRGTGGVLNARTRRGTTDGFHGSFKVDLVDAALFLEASLGKKTSLAVAARRSYVDAILSNVTAHTDSYGAVSIVPRYWDYQLRLDHGLATDRNSFTLMIFGSDDEMTASSSGGANAIDLNLGGGMGFHKLKASWVHRSGIFRNELTPSIGVELADFSTSGLAEDTGKIEADSNFLQVGLRDEASWQVGKSHLARLGLDFSYDRMSIAGELPFSFEYRPLPGSGGLTEMIDFTRTYHAFNVGLYHVWDLKLFDVLTLMPGLRLETATVGNNTMWALDPRLSFRWAIQEATVLKGGVGLYSQAPSPFYLDEDFGNPDLKFTRAIQSSLGVEQSLPWGLKLDASAFFIFGFDRVATTDEMIQEESGSLRAVRYVNGTKARNFGLELMVKADPSRKLTGWLSYTLSKSQRKLPTGTHYRNSSYDQTHILALVARLKIPRGWSVGTRFRLVSGNPQTPVIGSTFNSDTGHFIPISGEPYSDRAPLFHQLDLRADKEWTFKAWKLGVYLDIQNVYWANNTEYVLWDYRYRGSTGLPGMPFFPTLGVKGSW